MLNDENRYLFKFAWKSIKRNPGRSFFIGFSVSLAVMIAVWVTSVFDGMNTQIERAVVNTNLGFFQALEPTFARSTDASHPLSYAEKGLELVKSLPVKAASPELVLDGNISTPEGAAGLIVLGIEPELHKNFLRIHRSIIKGEFLTSDDESNIVIGQELARLFKFNIGDQIVLNYQDIKGELRSEILVIKGIYKYSSKAFEKRYVYTNQKSWQKIFLNEYKGETLFNRIAMMTYDGLHQEPQFRDKIQKSGLEFKTWKNLNPEMAVVIDFHHGMIRFFFLIIGITIMMTILTPVRMLWQERYKELRMMNIIGVSNNKFWKIGISEIIQMIALSSGLSSILLIIVIGIQSKVGLNFRNLNDGISIERAGIKLPSIIYPVLSYQQIVITFVFVIFVMGFSYLWSIYRTLSKLESEL